MRGVLRGDLREAATVATACAAFAVLGVATGAVLGAAARGVVRVRCAV